MDTWIRIVKGDKVRDIKVLRHLSAAPLREVMDMYNTGLAIMLSCPDELVPVVQTYLRGAGVASYAGRHNGEPCHILKVWPYKLEVVL